MSRKHLADYLDQRFNFWERQRGEAEVTVESLDDASAQEIFASLSGDLSPEHLYCDGEISATQARSKAKQFYGAANHLMSLGFKDRNKWSEFN